MASYKFIFFDIDRTLWDFDANVREAFEDIFEAFELDTKLPSVDTFFQKYTFYNDQLWAFYRKGLVKKEFLRIERFNKTLKDFGISDYILAREIGDHYMGNAPFKKNLVPHTFEALSYLKLKEYKLCVISNGFKEVQVQKLHSCDILKYFNKVITSDDVQKQKPNQAIFEHALKINNAKKDESIMVGDDYDTDIIGAGKFGMDQVYFNPEGSDISGHIVPTYNIKSLLDLKQIF